MNGEQTGIGCLVENISVGGAKVCATERLSLGEGLRLSIPDLPFSCPSTVIWATQEAAGLAFPKRSALSRRQPLG